MGKQQQEKKIAELETVITANVKELKDIGQRLAWLEGYNAQHGQCLAARVPDCYADIQRAERRLAGLREELRALKREAKKPTKRKPKKGGTRAKLQGDKLAAQNGTAKPRKSRVVTA